MTGVSFTVETPDLAAALARIARLGRLVDDGELLAVMGEVVVDQTVRRIADEKRAPDGAPWADWSDAYRATRESRHSLLVGEGQLREGIFADVSGREVRVGSPDVYAAIHQFGGAGVGKPGLPARPYLGLSADDAAELVAVVDGFVADAIGGARS